jgi:hypothetical protein
VPPEPTREELLAQVAKLQQQLQQAQQTSPFVREVPGVAPPTQPALKTSQAPPTQVAVPRDLQPPQPPQSADQILAQIVALKSLISSGVNSAGYGDKRTEFRSLTEMRQILNGLEEDLAIALGTGGRIRQIRMTTQADKGL